MLQDLLPPILSISTSIVLLQCVISIEMFEHMNNFHELMCCIWVWLKARDNLFVYIFTQHALSL